MVISFPTPAYSNPPIKAQYYEPSLFFIQNIALGKTTTVTTTADHNYVIGQLVRLLIPEGFGAEQLNERPGYVLSIPSLDQVVLDIDSLRYTPFTANVALPNQPQIAPIGDINMGNVSTSGRSNVPTNIPGSFINISPE